MIFEYELAKKFCRLFSLSKYYDDSSPNIYQGASGCQLYRGFGYRIIPAFSLVYRSLIWISDTMEMDYRWKQEIQITTPGFLPADESVKVYSGYYSDSEISTEFPLIHYSIIEYTPGYMVYPGMS